MANELVGGRYILDTAEAVVAAGTPIRLQSVCFVGTTDVDNCILHDGNGKLIWSCVLGDVSVNGCQAGHYFGKDGQVVDGLDLDTIANGVLYVYLAKL